MPVTKAQPPAHSHYISIHTTCPCIIMKTNNLYCQKVYWLGDKLHSPLSLDTTGDSLKAGCSHKVVLAQPTASAPVYVLNQRESQPS